MKNEHISKELCKEFHDGKLNEEQQLSFLGHIARCTYCAGVFASSFTEEALLAPPRNFSEQIFRKIEEKRPSPKQQLFSYSLRVCTAMCGALLILFATFFIPAQFYIEPENTVPKTFQYTKSDSTFFLEDIGQSLNAFTYVVDTKMSSFITFQHVDINKNGGN